MLVLLPLEVATHYLENLTDLVVNTYISKMEKLTWHF